MKSPLNSPSSGVSDDSYSYYETLSDFPSDIFHSVEYEIMQTIDINESSNREYIDIETEFYQRMKMYFLKHKLMIDLRIYFLYQ